jgi:hypothetical protein
MTTIVTLPNSELKAIIRQCGRYLKSKTFTRHGNHPDFYRQPIIGPLLVSDRNQFQQHQHILRFKVHNYS